jgi:hypothetical protein
MYKISWKEALLKDTLGYQPESSVHKFKTTDTFPNANLVHILLKPAAIDQEYRALHVTNTDF